MRALTMLLAVRFAAAHTDSARSSTRVPDPEEITAPMRQLATQKTVLLTTFRRSGKGVGTPVHVAIDNGRAYFRTFDAAWKVKRLRHTSEVEVAPATSRGKPTGPAFRATVREVHGEEAQRAARALARKYPFMHGLLIPWAHRLKGYRTLHFEISPLIAQAWKLG